jgi:hypothetical protein
MFPFARHGKPPPLYKRVVSIKHLEKLLDYRMLARYQEIAEPFESDRLSDEFVLSRTWRKRFDDGVREFVRVAAHFVVKQAQDREFSAVAVRPNVEIVDEVNRPRVNDETADQEFASESVRNRRLIGESHHGVRDIRLKTSLSSETVVIPLPSI